MEAPPDNGLLGARALRHSFQGSPALTGASVTVGANEILALVGPRGAGKSTLLRCLSGQLVPDEGEVWFDGMPVHTLPESARERLRRDRFGWIGADPQLLPELNVWENAALPLLLRGERGRTAHAAAREWLDRLDIGDIARRRPAGLPAAKRQRVAVARALITTPAVVFADEPTAPLHRNDRAHVLRTLTSAARTHGITVVLATSDPETAGHADRAVAFTDGRTGAPNAVAGVPTRGRDQGTGAGGNRGQDRDLADPRPATV